MKKKHLILELTCLLLVICSYTGYAQTKNVTGNVAESSGVPLPGVNVLVKGTYNGVITDVDGNYNVTVDEGQVLVFSFLGFREEEVVVGSANIYNVSLETEDTQLDEVVVIGYGTQKKSDITGAVASIDKERLDIVPNTNVVQALQGSVPGVVINNNSSSASGGDVSITIRGARSTGSSEPLIVLDGFPYDGSLSDITPTDIESIEVLKDASATAIYGSRAANGVILISSKKGKSGKTKFSFDTYRGFLNAVNLPDVLSAEEFYEFKRIRDPNAFDASEEEVFANGSGVDWIDLSLRDGTTVQHNLSVSGGSDKFKYFVSGTYLDVEGVRLNDNFERSTLRANLEVNATDWLKVGTNTQLSYSDFSGLGPDWNDAFYMNPLTTSHDENGDLTIYPWEEDVFFGNPLQNTLAENSDKRYMVISNLYFDVDLNFIPGLSYRLNTGAEVTHNRQGTFWGVNTKRGLENQGEAQVRSDFRTNVLLENIVNYNKEFGKHNLFLTGLYSYQEITRDDQDLDSQGFPNDVLTWRQANVAALVEPGYDYRKGVLLSSMLRANYTYDNRYLFTLTGRRDSYSAFGENAKDSEFFAAALAWNIHNESFMQNSFLSTLKLRGSYGEVGNQAVQPYESLTLLVERSYVGADGNSLPGYITDNELGNPSLSWETTQSLNVGIDYGFLDSRINGSVNFYRTNTTNLLAGASISPFHGATQINTNVGVIQNKGIELGVSATAVRSRNFSWSIDGNISFNENEWADIFGDNGLTDDVGNDWFIGQPVDVVFDLEYDGVFQLGEDIANSAQPDAEPGYAKAKDQLTVDTDGDGIPDAGDWIINADDRVIIGQRDPSTIAALGMNFKYGNFGLYVLTQGAFGHIKQNDLKNDNVFGEVRRNTTLKNWWSEDNPTNDFYANAENANSVGIRFYESSNYWRVRDITLSYDIDKKVLNRFGLDRFRIYATGRNLFTFTNYEGLDPEFNSVRGTPLQTTVTIGLNVNF